MKRSILAAAALSLALPAAAQQAEEPPSRHALMLAAGYKAAFTCSAVFNGGKTPDQIEQGELDRIYPGYREPLTLVGEAEIDRENRRVSVTWAEDMPPRVSAWRESLGCAQLPPGAPVEDAALLPRADVPAAPDRSGESWPMGDATGEIETPDALAPVVDSAFDGESFGDGALTSAILVVRDGEIVAERYMDGHDMHTAQRTWSVAKSVAASVIGAAVEDGLIAVDAPAPVPEWQGETDPRKEITLENLLHMSSGLYSGEAGNRTDNVYFGGSAVAQEAAQTQIEAAPGTRWKYANNDTMLAMRSLRAAMDDDAAYLAYPFTALLRPLGMDHTTPETDWNGDFVMSSQVWTTARDLARLGLLYLNDGVWEGERILPDGWTDYVAAPAPDQPEREYGYGAQFWLLGAREGVPQDAYAAMGNRGQYLVIVPSEDLLVIRRGYDGDPGETFDIGAFTAAVTAALD